MKKLLSLILVSLFFVFIGVNSLKLNAATTVDVSVTGIFDSSTPGNSFTFNATPSFGGTISIDFGSAPMDQSFAFYIVNGVVRKDLPQAHVFTVSTRMQVQVVFTPTGKYAVVFIGSNGEYLGVKYAGLDNSFTVDDTGISTPTRPGYLVASGESKWTSIEGSTGFSSVDANSVFVLQYVSDSSIADVTIAVTGGTGAGSYSFNSAVTVVAGAAEPGQKFSHWSEGSVKVSTQASYTFTALKDRTLVANYVTEATVLDDLPFVTLSDDLALRSGYESYAGQYYLPSGYSLVEYGFLVSKSADQLTLESLGVTIAQSSNQNSYNEFVTSFVEAAYRSVRAYLVVKDGSEAIQKYYSETYFRNPAAGEMIVYQTGFEAAEGFTASTNYSTSYVLGPSGQQWSFYYGTSSTTSPLIGAQSAQMRWYTTAPGNLGYVKSNFSFNDVTDVKFYASSTANLKVQLSYSTDDISYVGEQIFELTTSSTQYTYSVNQSNVYIKFEVVLPDPIPAETSRVYIDGIQVYGVVTDALHEVLLDNGSTIDSELVINGNSVSSPNPTKTGYSFNGWYFEDTLVNPYSNAPITYSLTLYAKWTINQYTITFNSNGGSAVSAITDDYNASVSAPSDPTREGYTFAGWYSDVGLTSAYTFSTMPAQSITLYAKWTINQYTITFDSNGGSSVTAITQDYGTEVAEPTPPTQSGFVFSGWYSDDVTFNNAYSFTTMPAQNITIYAKWVEESGTTYAVTFDSNEGSAVATQDVAEGGQAAEPIDPTRSGYVFDGWYTDDVTFENLYNFSTSVNAPITLYAKWVVQYTLTIIASTNSGTINYTDYLTGPTSTTYVSVSDVTDSYGVWSGIANKDAKGFGQKASNYLTYTAQTGYYIYSIQIEGNLNSTTTAKTVSFAGQVILSGTSNVLLVGSTVLIPGNVTSGTFATNTGTSYLSKIVIVCREIPNP